MMNTRPDETPGESGDAVREAACGEQSGAGWFLECFRPDDFTCCYDSFTQVLLRGS